MKNKITIGTRSSKLALWQANFVKEKLLVFYPDLNIELKEIKTKGDHILDVALSKIGDKGLFTKEIEESILNNEVDLAVHSLKDLPTKLPDGLKIGAVLNRESAHDVMITRDVHSGHLYSNISLFSPGSKIGTSSLRRISQLKAIRSDLEYLDIRGNLDTRIKKLDEGYYDAIVLAYAGVKRLGFENRISYHFNTEEILPAVGQGALAIEIREKDCEIENLILKLDDKDIHSCIIAERAFLRRLQGGCQVPIGAYAKFENQQITLTGLIASLSGDKIVKNHMIGNMKDSEFIGIDLAELLLRNGGEEIVKSFRNTV